MSISNHGRFRQQVRFLRRQFLQDGELPFTDVLSEGTVAQALKALNTSWLDRIYSPLVTLWVFLGQVLCQDHSCRAAAARLIAHRVSRGQRPCSAETGAYCQARKRLPEEFYAEVARKAGQSLDNNAKKEWLWKGRRVLVYDGSKVSMPDTAKNQQAYPQPPQQRPGIGLLLTLAAGCQDKHPDVVPVSGTVTIDGQLLKFGQVMISPSGHRPSIGPIDEDGRFTMTCFETGDGVLKGTHLATVTAVEQIDERSNRWHAPKKYANKVSSGIWGTIDEPTDDLKIDLTWERSKQKGSFVDRF